MLVGKTIAAESEYQKKYVSRVSGQNNSSGMLKQFGKVVKI